MWNSNEDFRAQLNRNNAVMALRLGLIDWDKFFEIIRKTTL